MAIEWREITFLCKCSDAKKFIIFLPKKNDLSTKNFIHWRDIFWMKQHR